MKKLIVLSVVMVAVSLVNAQAQSMSQGKAVVRAIRGTAQYSTGGNVWVPLKVGTVLKAGSTVKTAADSQVDCFLGDNGPVVRVTSDTQMGFDKLSYSKNDAETVVDTEINLANGRILGNVKKLAAASKYEVKVPNGVAGIRGTDYEVKVTPRADGKFDVTVTCVTGQIVAAVVVDGVTRTAVLGDGMTWSALSGQTIKLTPEQIAILKAEFPKTEFNFPPAGVVFTSPGDNPLTGGTGNPPDNGTTGGTGNGGTGESQ